MCRWEQSASCAAAAAAALQAHGQLGLHARAHEERPPPLPTCHHTLTLLLFTQDMTTLSHLHEPGVLHNLSVRYTSRQIYTAVGSILIAVNPFASIPELFKPGTMEAYVQVRA
jgi:myosin heavy subunit